MAGESDPAFPTGNLLGHAFCHLDHIDIFQILFKQPFSFIFIVYTCISIPLDFQSLDYFFDLIPFIAR